MAKREKFGKFVLLDEVEGSGLGTDYRAAKLGSAGLEKIVSVLRIKPSLSGNADAVKSLMDQVKVAAQLQNPNVLKIYGIGKVDAAYYISYEFMEGKSLRSIFNRCRQEGFPFSVDHALLICSKICSALEYAHGRKSDAGGRYFHGLLTPASVLVSYEGEVRVRGFGYWPSKIREAGALTDEDSQYLAPEQAAGGAGDPRSDIFAVGAILFETLTGEPLLQGARMQDIAGRLAQARLQNPTTDDDSLPKPIAEILRRSLAEDPGGRYGEIQEVRKAIDTLLFSGDFTPTTFNLAFFMHSLFREDIEREGRALKDDKDANYLEFLDDAKPATPTPVPAMHTPVPRSEPVAAEPIAPTVMVTTPVPRAAAPAPPPAPVQHHEPEAPRAAAKEVAAPAFSSFDKAPPAASKTPMLAIGAVVLIGLGVAGYFMFGSKPPATPSPSPLAPSTLSADQIRLKELEQKLADIEAAKKAEEDKAAEETKKKLEAKAKAEGTKVDPEELRKAQEAAAAKARVEAEKKAAEEKARLEAEQKTAREAEERRVAEEKARAEEAARAAAATTLAAAPSTQAAAPAVKPGDLVKLSDPGVLPPLAEKKGQLEYPAIARSRRIEGVVGISALVDERGSVIDAKVVNEVGGKAGLNEAALDYVKKWKFRPASLGGVPVKVWTSVNVKFSLQ